MKIKMLTLMAGPDGTFTPGQELDVEKKTADALVSGGFAMVITPPPDTEPVPVTRQEKPETAIRKPSEKAVKNSRR